MAAGEVLEDRGEAGGNCGGFEGGTGREEVGEGGEEEAGGFFFGGDAD